MQVSDPPQHPPPLKTGDTVVVTGPDYRANGVVEAVASWQWIRFRTDGAWWLDVMVDSSFVSWSLLCRLDGPTSDADCDRIADDVGRMERAKVTRGLTDVPGLTTTLGPEWQMARA